MTYGQTAYEAYFAACEGKSLISGVPLPSWDGQAEKIQDAWNLAGATVAARVDAETRAETV
jgi:hypothetical protein